MRYDKEFISRKNTRLKGYDYRTPNYYFVTICTHERSCLFGNPKKLNKSGQIAASGFQMIETSFPGVLIDKAVVMPNHVHAIIVLTDSQHNLSAIVGAYKSYVTRCLHDLHPQEPIWQKSFHDHIIRNQKIYERIWKYIENNPIKWEDDCFYVQRFSASE